MIFIIIYNLFYIFIGEKIISPDLDVLGISKQDSRLLEWRNKNIVIGIFLLVYYFWWMFYAWLIWKHRSIWSHGWGIGTIIRFVWILMPFIPAINFIGTFNGWELSEYYYQMYGDYYLISVLLGLFWAMFWSDAVHLVLDLEQVKGILYIPKSTKRGNKKNELVGIRNIQDRTVVRKKWVASFRNHDKIIRSKLHKRYKKIVH